MNKNEQEDRDKCKAEYPDYRLPTEPWVLRSHCDTCGRYLGFIESFVVVPTGTPVHCLPCGRVL